jgi:DNA ligase-1
MFKPMLAGVVPSLDALRYPVFMSPKLDGIRAVVHQGVLVSRTLKPIPNVYTRTKFSVWAYEGFDGELTVGDPTAPDCFNRTTSDVMRREGSPDVTFRVFDRVAPLPFFQRRPHEALSMLGLEVVDQILVESAEEALQVHTQNLAMGYEGSMVRDPDGPYKQGRSTAKEGFLLKLKPFADDEAVIIGFEEQMANHNESKVNALGHTERSSHKDRMMPTGVLGALRVRNTAGMMFSIGTGFTAADRADIWNQRDLLLDQTIRYRYQAEGMKDVPRFPVFAGFRKD